MGRWLMLFLLLMGASESGAATLRVRLSLPTQDNADTTCTVPILTSMGTNLFLKGHWRFWPAGGDSINGATQDSLAGSPGALILRDYQIAAGLYRIRAWATDLGGKSCDTLVTASTFKVKPWHPTWAP